MDEHTQILLDKTEQLFQQFRSRVITLEELQNGIVGIASAFEGGLGNQIGTALNKLEGDLEHIRFMSQPEEHFPDALDRITQTERAIRNVRGAKG